MERSYLLRTQIECDTITQFDSIGLVYFFIVYFDFSRSKPLKNPSERSIRKVFSEEFIDTLFRIRWIIDSKENHKVNLLKDCKIKGSVGRNLWKLKGSLSQKSITKAFCPEIHILGRDDNTIKVYFILQKINRSIGICCEYRSKE